MEDLIKRLQDRVNLDRERAEEAVETVKGFIRDRVPGPLSEPFVRLLEGSEDAASKLRSYAEKIPGLGGVFAGSDTEEADAVTADAVTPAEDTPETPDDITGA